MQLTKIDVRNTITLRYSREVREKLKRTQPEQKEA